MPLALKMGLAKVFSDFCDVGQKSQVACSLDGPGQLPLMAGAGAGLTAGANFTFFGHKAPQNINLLVIDGDILIGAELANLGARNVAPPTRLLFAFHIHFV